MQMNNRAAIPVQGIAISAIPNSAVPAIQTELVDVLTIPEVAAILRCSRNHVANAMNGRVPGVPALPHFVMGRRKLVRREWLAQWLQSYRTEC